jgi:hypothetical protein
LLGLWVRGSIVVSLGERFHCWVFGWEVSLLGLWVRGSIVAEERSALVCEVKRSKMKVIQRDGNYSPSNTVLYPTRLKSLETTLSDRYITKSLQTTLSHRYITKSLQTTLSPRYITKSL